VNVGYDEAPGGVVVKERTSNWGGKNQRGKNCSARVGRPHQKQKQPPTQKKKKKNQTQPQKKPKKKQNTTKKKPQTTPKKKNTQKNQKHTKKHVPTTEGESRQGGRGPPFRARCRRKTTRCIGLTGRADTEGIYRKSHVLRGK